MKPLALAVLFCCSCAAIGYFGFADMNNAIWAAGGEFHPMPDLWDLNGGR